MFYISSKLRLGALRAHSPEGARRRLIR